MKMTGGYLPKIAGQPSGKVRTVDVPARLVIALHQDGLVFHPAVPDGARVQAGQIIADQEHPGGKLALPAPAGGTLKFEEDAKGLPVRLILTVSDHTPPQPAKRFTPGKAKPDELRKALAAGGIWQRLWSSSNGGPPPLTRPTGRPAGSWSTRYSPNPSERTVPRFCRKIARRFWPGWLSCPPCWPTADGCT